MGKPVTGRSAAVVLLGLAALWLTLGVTVAGVVPKSMAGRTLGVFLFDARAGAASAVTVTATGNLNEFAAAGSLARRALLRDPTSVDAVAALGLMRLAKSDRVRANRLFSYAYRLSRRDFGTLIWRIQERIQANDVDGALQLYDIAMRTSAKAPPILLPTLARAVRNPYVAQRVDVMLARNPFWMTAFFEPLVQVGEPKALFALTRGRLSLKREADQFLTRAAVSRFLREGRLDRAWSFYDSVAGAAGRIAMIRNGNFESPPIVPPMDWSLAQDPALSGLLQVRPNGGSAALFLYSEDERSGEVARQLLKLPAGKLLFTAKTGDVSTRGKAPAVRLECAEGSPIFNASLTPNAVSVPFAVPAGCPFQWLVLEAGQRRLDEPVPWIDDIRIDKVG